MHLLTTSFSLRISASALSARALMPLLVLTLPVVAGGGAPRDSVPASAVTPTARVDSLPLPSLLERAAIAAELHTAISMRFAHWDGVPNLDFRALFHTYLEQSLAATTRREFTLASLEFIAALHNGHSWFYDTALREASGPRVPFTARSVDGVWVVDRSADPQLHVGDVIESIDGASFETYYRERRKYMPATTDRYARFEWLAGDYDSSILFPLRFTLTLQGGRTVTIDRTHGPGMPQDLQPTGRMLDGRTAYIRIPSFLDPGYEQHALELVRQLHDATSMIIDVRGNRGGITPIHLLDGLMDRSYRWFRHMTPRYTGTGRQRQYVMTPASVEHPDSTLYAGPLAILIDVGCASACEGLVVSFKDNGRATLVGDTTGGSSGQPYFLSLDAGRIRVGIGARREYMPDGSPFEGVGIAPDVFVRRRADDYREGGDPALERARTLLAEADSGHQRPPART